MGVLGTAASKAVDAATGTTHGTTLEEFLSKFSSTAGVFVDTIDPLHTFEVEFKFFPTPDVVHEGLAQPTGEKGFLAALGASLAESGMNALNNLGDSLTGGLLGAIVNANKPKLMDLKPEYVKKDSTFIKYLIEGNKLINSNNYIQQAFGLNSGSSSEPLTLSLGFYVQSIVIPKLQIKEGQTIDTLCGSFSIPGNILQPDTNTLIMSVINTKVPLLERIFYPWMREVTLPYWSYKTCPYTTATIKVDMTKHSDISYVFFGCRPTVIQTEQPTQEPDSNITRDITFQFDHMIVSSKLNTCDSILGKVMGVAGNLASSAGNLVA